jgi:hypothetical protein
LTDLPPATGPRDGPERLVVLPGSAQLEIGSPERPTLLEKKVVRRVRSPRVRTVKIKNRSQVIQYSRTLIAALNEVLDYDRERHHNQPPPELLIEDADYLREIRNLVAELRTLNSFLESSRRPAKKTSQAVGRLANHFDNFLKSYGKSLGKGAGWLTIAVMASLLSQTGLGQDVVANILSHAKLPR